MAECPTTSDVLVLEIPLTLHTVILTSIPPIVAEKLLPVVVDPTPRAKGLVTTITVLTGIVLLLMRSTEISFVPTRTCVVITKLHEGQVLRPPVLDHARCLVHRGKFVSVVHLFLLRRTPDMITGTYKSVLDDDSKGECKNVWDWIIDFTLPALADPRSPSGTSCTQDSS